MTDSHLFAIPVYGQPPHLTECVESILNQSRRSSRIVISTSTPSAFVEEIAQTYRIPLLVNPVRADIATDWNFALATAEADMVTIAHQDDVYDRRYVDTMFDAIARHPGVLMAFSDYCEHTTQGPRSINMNLRIKRLLCSRAFGARETLDSYKAKRRLLTLGNPICCPSVVINRGKIPDFRFSAAMKTDLDWEAWARMAKLSGEFLYVRNILVSKRVHAESETSVTIANRVRETEDRLMFEQFWPKPVASAILAFYKLGYLANRI